MNLAEVWFGILERQAIRRGVFKSVRDLNTKIRTFINGWNDRSHPLVWTKTAEDPEEGQTVQQPQIRATSAQTTSTLAVAQATRAVRYGPNRQLYVGPRRGFPDGVLGRGATDHGVCSVPLRRVPTR